MNQVDKITLNFIGKDESFFRDLHADFNTAWSDLLERVTDRVLLEWSNPNVHLEIDKLILDLPPIGANNFKKEFLVQYETILERELIKVVKKHQGEEVITKARRDRTELLFHYLLHGHLLWRPGDSSFNLQDLFLEILKNNSAALYKFLRTHGHYTSLQERIIYQLEEKSLYAGIKLLAPNDSQFIVSYIKALKQKYKRLTQPQITETNYQYAVWKVIYAYVLTMQTTYFNKKMFVKQTIVKIGNHYNINYNHLLRLLWTDQNEDHISGELYLILQNLFQEEKRGIVKRKNWRHWIQLIAQIEGTLLDGLKREKNTLIQLLKSDNSIYLLQLLNEQEILTLVDFVIPNEAPFIRNYTSVLDQNQQKGLLQGKAGGEFRLLKWQIIFPILFQNNGANFNRKYFVEKVILKIAAHYNLQAIQLLNYWSIGDKVFQNDKVLLSIWKELLNKYEPSPTKSKGLVSVHKDHIILAIRRQVVLTVDQIDRLKEWVESSTEGIKFIERLDPIALQHFIKVNFKKDAEWIIHYASYLDLLENSKFTALKLGGKFTTIKWLFILQTLLGGYRQSLNKKYFVEQVLAKLSDHYNIKKDVIIKILTDNIGDVGYQVPYDLFKVLNDLRKYAVVINKKDPINDPKSNSADEAAENAFIHPILDLLASILGVFDRQTVLRIDKKHMLFVLGRYRSSHSGHSQLDILRFILSWLLGQVPVPNQKSDCLQQLTILSERSPLLQAAIQQEKLQRIMEQDNDNDEVADINTFREVHNAGVILIAAYLPRLFSILKYTENGQFCNQEKQIRAVFLIQYLIFGNTEYPEHELYFNKILTGIRIDKALPNSLDLTKEEMEVSNQMLASILMHWQKVKTIGALREGFLQRGGLLYTKDDVLELSIDQKAFDMLLDYVSWNYKTIRFQWMEKTILTNWR
ncbi:contractile injection system tape measure protein [Sphingobacterium paucimobilis]|uniref:Uncharacterized protein n=1 Tax=Sphingobacterium paucimobilis HER1398 TaxID=1346330 RepID=U2JB09_9SPHI|nr:contractile injection system tape measure protein [Sphingobacterium paucimobilis]ERJ59853.1 hypothetical protein M472_13865 [Sphingobacterium paucimobilis HER1398]